MASPAHTHASTDSPWGASLLESLRERPEVQVAAAYVGGAWLCYDVADLMVFAFDLPDVILRVILGLLALGAIVALFFGRWLRLTLLEVRKGRPDPDEDIRGVPDFLEPVLIRAAGVVSGRTAILATAASTLVFLVLFLLLWHSWAAAHERQVTDPRITLAVFPFGDAGGEELGAGVADLLAVTIDGTPGLRVVDPSTAWQSLAGSQEEDPPDLGPAEARSLGRDLGVSRFVTGDLLRSGSRIEIAARVHDLDRRDDSVPLRLSAHEDSLGAALERLAVEIVAVVWQRGQLPTVPEIDRSATASAEALKAYLEAKSAVRHGRMEDARRAIERAVALDSTFALAHLERFSIESWLLFAQGRPISGLRPIVERAARHSERLTPRNRMRIDARRALDATDGARAAFLFERILAIDSLDLDALEGLAYTNLVYGWQIERGPDAIVAAHERIVRADSSNPSALATLARMAMWRNEAVEARRWMDQLMRVDSLGAYARGTYGAYELMTAPVAEVDRLLSAWAGRDVAVVTTVLRDLRTARPDLADRYLTELTADTMPTYHRRLGRGGRAQLWMARGRIAAVDSLVATGELESLRVPLAAYQVAAALAGVGDPNVAARSAADLAAYTPLDSLGSHLGTRDVWITGWAVAAYHGVLGDTVEAQRWLRGLARLPPGETMVPEWPSALAADVEARIAVRRDDTAAAERAARRAYELWPLHSFTALEHHPEPAMRFHLAELLRTRGADGAAEALYRSLCPPHTWMGFYTARSSLELGRFRETAGEPEEAAQHYRMAIRFWEAGDPSVVGHWLEEARAGLIRTTR